MEQRIMPIFLTGPTKWPEGLFSGMGNTGGADLGIERRSPALDMLSLSCVGHLSWTVQEVAAPIVLELRRNIGMEKIWIWESPAF